MDTCTEHRSLATCASLYDPVRLQSTEDLRRWLQADSLASPSAWPVDEEASTTNAICGQPRGMYLASFDRESHSWKTYPGLFPADIFQPCSPTLPQWGTMRAGALYLQRTPARLTSESDSGFLPTPVVPNGGRQHKLDNLTVKGKTLYRGDGSKAQLDLQTYARLWPTPTKTNASYTSQASKEKYGCGMTLQEAVASSIGELAFGKLNPNWVDWLMGYPIGWSALEEMETDRSRFQPHWHFDFWLAVNGDALERMTAA